MKQDLKDEESLAAQSNQEMCYVERPTCEKALGRKEIEQKERLARHETEEVDRSQFMQSLVDHVKDLNSLSSNGKPFVEF